MSEDDDIAAEALRWHREVAGDDADWDAFTAWLEADPAHARAYDAVALAETLLDEHGNALARKGAPAAVAAGDNVVPFRRAGVRPWHWVAGLGAAAASLALVWGQAERVERFDSGVTARTITLADGTSIALAPRSHLEQRGTHFTLTGDAVFDVPHRPNRSMQIAAGPLTVTDIGTRFDLRVQPGAVRVVVAEGRLDVTGPGFPAPIDLTQGHALRFDEQSSQVTVAPASDSAAGDWQAGHLTYDNAPLSLVIADIARYGGQPIQIDANLTTERFSGTLLIGDGHDPASDLARLMGLALRRSAGGARLSAAPPH